MSYDSVLIAGPTASGKSTTAAALAQHVNAVIINTDSMQVYKDLRILTARPCQKTETETPHSLYGVLDGDDPCSAGRYQRMAMQAYHEAKTRNQLPIFVGGTGLYFRTLTDGLANIPDIPEEIRTQAETDYSCLGGAAFRIKLISEDPGSRLLMANDRQRLIRARAVLDHTGKPLSYWHQQPSPPVLQGRLLKIYLTDERAILYERAEKRLDHMMEDGALDEVKKLAARRLDPARPVMRALGVRPFLAHLRGDLTQTAAIRRTKTDTRRYIKRQLTWISSNMVSWIPLNTKESEINIIREFSKITKPS